MASFLDFPSRLRSSRTCGPTPAKRAGPPRARQTSRLAGSRWRATSRSPIGSRRARGPSASPGIRPSPPASAGSARLRLASGEEGRGFFSRRRSPSRARVCASSPRAARGLFLIAHFLRKGTAVEILDQKRTGRTIRMCSAEQRAKAIETFARFGCSAADTIAELGYPSRVNLNLPQIR